MKQVNGKKILYIISAILVAGLWMFASLELALWGSFAVVALLFAVPVQIVGTAAMMLLLMVAGSQLFAATAVYSEQLAVYVFYMLCIMVVLQVRSVWEDGELEPLLPAGITFSPRVRPQLVDTPSYSDIEYAVDEVEETPLPRSRHTQARPRRQSVAMSTTQPRRHMDIIRK